MTCDKVASFVRVLASVTGWALPKPRRDGSVSLSQTSRRCARDWEYRASLAAQRTEDVVIGGTCGAQRGAPWRHNAGHGTSGTPVAHPGRPPVPGGARSGLVFVQLVSDSASVAEKVASFAHQNNRTTNILESLLADGTPR